MKIFFAIKKLSSMGGAERVLCTICSELVSRGHDITIVSFDQKGTQPFYPLDGRVKRIDLGIGDSTNNTHLYSRLKALRRTVKQEQPEIVIGFMLSMIVPLAFALVGTGIPVLASEHIVAEHYRKRPLQYALLKMASLYLSKITVLSEQIRKGYPESLRKKMVVMPNPVVTASGKAQLDVIKPRYVLLNIGRLELQKDHSTLIRSFGRISNIYPDWELKIFGEGSLRSELENLIKSMGLENRVHMPGITSQIENEYCNADIFVISSHYEGFGLVTAEAMSYGLPVIGFEDCPGTNELIQDGYTGILATGSSDRVKALTCELEKVLSDPALRMKLGDAAKAAIGSKFSIKYVGDLWEELLGNINSK